MEEDAVTHLRAADIGFLGKYLCILVWLPVEGMQHGPSGSCAAELPSTRGSPLRLQRTLPCAEKLLPATEANMQPETALPHFHINSFLFSLSFFLLPILALYAMPLLAKQMIVKGS